MNGMTVDPPSGHFQLENGRIWFVTEARDWSAGVTLAFPEQAALELQGCSREEFLERANEKALSFQRANLRVVRTITKGYISCLVHDVHRVEQFSEMTAAAKMEYACQLDVTNGRQGGSVVPCPLARVQLDAFEGFEVGKNCSCTKIVCLVKGLRTSQMENLGDTKRKMITDVACQLSPDEKVEGVVRVVGYCLENFVSDFKIDKQHAYVLVTQIDEREDGIDLIAENVQIVSVDEIRQMRSTLQAEIRMLNLEDDDMCTPANRAKRGLDSPQALLDEGDANKAKRPKSIKEWPSDA